MIYAIMQAHSIAPNGVEIATLELSMPRFILAQFNTHRMFSRNAASSRAIPTSKMIAKVLASPFRPSRWGTAQKGMVAGAELSPENQERADHLWQNALEMAVGAASSLAELGVAKEHVNRLLEPFAWVKVLVTATDWENFFSLRLAHDAQPEMQELAREMQTALHESRPEYLYPGEWHMPFSERVPPDLALSDRLRVVAARCARLSYATHDGEFSIARDLDLATQLDENGHHSPFEHCAVCRSDSTYYANLYSWQSYRNLYL